MLRETGKIQFLLLFLCEGSTSFCSKGFCYSYAMSCSLCVGRTFVWTGLIPRTSSGFLFMFSTGFTWFSGLLPFPLLITLFVFVHGCWCYLLANLFVFKYFNVQHKVWLTYSGETNRLGELCYKFSISDKLTQIVNFPTWKIDYDCHSLSLLDLFLSSATSLFYVVFVILHWEFFAMLVILRSLNSKGMLLFITQLFITLVSFEMVLLINSWSSWWSSWYSMGWYV